MNVLIIEDDKEVGENIATALIEKGNSVELVSDGIIGLEKSRLKQFDVLLVDRMIPRLSGLDIVKELRKDNINTPVLIISALGQTNDIVEGLSVGADDYLAKPFDFSELLARLKVLSKRNLPINQSDYVLKVDNLELNKMERTVYREGNEIILQSREFNLLKYLLEHKGETVTRKMLLKDIWGYDFKVETNVVDVHISRLRGKIDGNFSNPLILAVRGQGYTIK